MELLDILQSESVGKEPLTQERKKLLCNKINRLDITAAKSVYTLIVSYYNRFEIGTKIGVSKSDIPYYGEEIPNEGMIFSLAEFPDELLILMEIIVKEADLLPDEDNSLKSQEINGDSDELLGFILHNVSRSIVNNQTKNRHNSKFKSVKRNKPNIKLESHTTYEGYSIKFAHLGEIECITPSEEKICFHDGHPFDGLSICMPIDHNYVGKKHVFVGNLSFCSIFCLDAHVSHLEKLQIIHQPHNIKTIRYLTTFMFTLMYPDEKILRSAPDREELDVWGGQYSIALFRNKISSKRYVDSGNILFEISSTTRLEL